MLANPLRERLASLGGGLRPLREPSPERRLPRGFEPVDTPWGTAWRLQEVHPIGRLPGTPPAIPFAYLDTETTGLAGGSGTYAFTVALARPLPDRAGLEVVQLFLPEPSAEAAFLHLLQEEVAVSPAIGTYNGSRFDLPLLRTRWVMARLPGDFEHPDHLDLLTLTRSLLRQRLQSCALRNVEIRLLGFEREEDLPSAMVPDAYFAYLRRGWSPDLEGALAHNRQDVLSLYHLHSRLLLRLSGGDPHMEAADWLALGRHLSRQGRRAEGWRSLRNAVEMSQAPASGLAGILIARRLIRGGRALSAARLLRSLFEREPEDPMLATALARVLEWKLRDPDAALRVVERALSQHHLPQHRADLGRRRERLANRLTVRPRSRKPSASLEERRPTAAP